MELECLGLLHTKNYNEEFCLLKCIGEGQYSRVYLSLGKDNQHYAIKLFNDVESYLNETSRISELIPSKHIVKLYSFGEGILERGYSEYSYKLFNYFNTENTIRYAIFEYLSNGELFNYILKIKKSFPEDISKKIFYDLLKAVEVCHGCGITHGDIKLENILLSSNYTIKLIDFGFAKNISEGLISTITGSKGYAAPECFTSSTKEYQGIPTDIFSLGVVLFLLVMGFYPFDRTNCTDSRYKLILKKDYNGFWKKCEKLMNPKIYISNEFKDLFEKMICYKPEERLSIFQIKNHPWLVELNGKKLEHNYNNCTNMENSDDSKIDFLMNNNLDRSAKQKSNFSRKTSKDNISKNNKFNDIIMIQNKDDINKNGKSDGQSKSMVVKSQNTKYKELELKYLNELSKRKVEIDKILRDEEE